MTANELLILRRDAGVTQGALSEAIGYSRQAIVKWERGCHAIPDKAVPAIMEACTKHIPKPAGLTQTDKDALAQYTKMRQQPGEIGTHAYILAFWQNNGFTPSPAAQAAILAAFPDILNNGDTK